MNKSLVEIANKYGTDKGTIGPSLFYGAHNYTDIYEAYFERERENNLNILEIGIGVSGYRWKANIVHGRNKEGGASIKMWYDYFPCAHIYCIDINPASYLNKDRIHTFIVDQGDVSDMNNFLLKIRDTTFDYIIDDGSHRPDHQQTSLGLLFPKLKSKGIYFIEDLENNGLGDVEKARNKGRHKNDKVYNSRKLLKTYISTGNFMEPNNLVNSEYLKENIQSIVFHAPLHRFVPLAIINRLIGKRGIVVQYKENSERLCAITKK